MSNNQDALRIAPNPSCVHILVVLSFLTFVAHQRIFLAFFSIRKLDPFFRVNDLILYMYYSGVSDLQRDSKGKSSETDNVGVARRHIGNASSGVIPQKMQIGARLYLFLL